MLWESGVRDPRPRQVQLSRDEACWALEDGGVLVVRRHGPHLELVLAPRRVWLPLVPLVELIQVLDAWAVISS